MASKSEQKQPRMDRSSYTSHGLSLPPATLKALQKRGIYCAPSVSVEHQHLAKRYVLRGVESGGAVADMGRACAFVAPDGQPLPWLQSIDSIAVNGRHSIYLGESLIRVEMLRVVRTYELAITLHSLSVSPGRIRPAISSKMIFRGRDGSLALELWKEGNRALRGNVIPDFYSRGGETTALPSHLENAVRGITTAVCCIGCRHTHLGIPPAMPEKALGCATNFEVGAPNWEPLERVLSPEECADFMYMGRTGEIELYKHRLTRRYLNIGRNSQSYYEYRDRKYVEITRSAALDHLRR
jgi:hypothetical protein